MKRLFKLPPTIGGVKKDVDAELSFHFEGRVDDLIATGLSRADAEREARRRFGDRAHVEAEVERIDRAAVAQRRLRDRMAGVWRDARYAARGLVRRPLYASAVVLTLALAIGANTAVFSVVEAVLLRPFAFPALGRLAVVRDDFPSLNLRNTTISPLEALDLFPRRDLFTTATAYTPEGASAAVHEHTTRVSGVKTLGDFWTVFGGAPLHGRTYGPRDSERGSAPVVMLSYAFWQQLSGDTAILGQSLSLDDRTYEVIGILPRTFSFPNNPLYYRPFVPDSVMLDNKQSRGTLTQVFVGRMRDGLTIPALTAQLRTLAVQWHTSYEYPTKSHTMFARSFVDVQAGDLKPIIVALFWSVVFVLLVACANVASLQLVRAVARARELAVRAALGAGRAAIARQLVVESMLLALAGGVAGVALGKLALVGLGQMNIVRFPALRGLRLDTTVLAFTTGIALLSGLAFGTAPALRAARTNVNDALRGAGRGSSTGRAQYRFLKASVVAQNALVLVLMVAAGLTIRSLGRLLATDPGFDASRVAAFMVTLPTKQYRDGPTRLTFFRSLDERLKAIPGVQSVGFALGVPFMGGTGSTTYVLKSIPKQNGEPDRHANQAFVYGDYFKTMGIAIVRGRAFTDQDYATGSATMIVDESLVHQSFGALDPLGTLMEHGPQGTIIGVARPVKVNGLDDSEHPMVYHDYGHTAGYISTLTAVVRTSLPLDQIIAASRSAMADIDPALPVVTPRWLADRISDSVGPRQLATTVIAGFAGIALILALLGVYAVMTYMVNQRSREIGIRVALGAQRGQVARMILRDGALMAAFGLGAGAAAFAGLSRVVRSLLYGIAPTDPVAIGIAVVLLACVTLAACWLPARRATRVDPVNALRSE